MNIRFVTAGVFLALIATSLAQSATIDEAAARRSKMNQIGVSFGKSLPQHIPSQNWIGKHLSEVLPVSNIAKLILVKADTQATGDIDLLNIYGTLARDSSFYEHDKSMQKMYSAYEAVILTQDNKIFYLQIGADQDGGGTARLTSDTGEYGYFK